MPDALEIISFEILKENLVATRRAEMGISQETCAHHARISTTTLSNIENGEGCHLETAWRLAVVLRSSVERLFKASYVATPAPRRS